MMIASNIILTPSFTTLGWSTSSLLQLQLQHHHHHHARYDDSGRRRLLFQAASPQQESSSSSSSSPPVNNGEESKRTVAAASGIPSTTTTTSTSNTNTNTNGGREWVRSIIHSNSNNSPSQLLTAFTSLTEGDQYDAVLTGLCAKILETSSSRRDNNREKRMLSEPKVDMQDPIQLLMEMNERNIRASPRSVMALIDSVERAHSTHAMTQVLELCKKNGALNAFGNLIPTVRPFPPNPNSKTTTSKSMTTMTRAERLASIVVPYDDREKEVTAALAALAVVGSCLVVDGAHWDDVAVYTNTLLGAMLSLGILDNCYDLLSMGVKAVWSSSKKSKNHDGNAATTEFLRLPRKEDLPFTLGTGSLSGAVLRGLARLSTIDTERESQCEAAALLVAYQLGLPCFAFRPNALEGSIMVVGGGLESESESSSSSSSSSLNLNTPSGIIRMLVWLLAPVALEHSKHAQLICSDPREADGLLRRLEEYSYSHQNNFPPILLPWERQDREDLVKWAYAEADLLVRDNKGLVDDVAKCLTSGAGTVGDCVAIIERWQ